MDLSRMSDNGKAKQARVRVRVWRLTRLSGQLEVFVYCRTRPWQKSSSCLDYAVMLDWLRPRDGEKQSIPCCSGRRRTTIGKATKNWHGARTWCERLGRGKLMANARNKDGSLLLLLLGGGGAKERG
jgi:hypothetical protein